MLFLAVGKALCNLSPRRDDWEKDSK